MTAATPFAPDQVQPASLDLRLGAVAWRVRASFLPGKGRRVMDRLPDVAMHRLDLAAGAVLERGCVYIVEVQERLKLPAGVAGRANPKSSTGRVDVFVRLLTDGGPRFDDVEPGYQGPLYAEISPQTFSVLVRAGTRLNQLRLKRGDPPRHDPSRTLDLGRAGAFSIAPTVAVDNETSEDCTVIEASGRDRHGLLGDLAGAIARHGLSIQSAHIDNYGERAVDAFYVQDKGAKLAQRKAHALRSNLLEVLGEAESQAQPRGALSLERARASVGR